MKMRNMLKNKWYRIGLFSVLGAVAGYSYYYFIGCTGNSCPLTSNPYISSGYGMMVGLLMSIDTKKKNVETAVEKGE